MASIHSEDTRPEQAVRRELWHRGYRFRKCVRTLPGTPDIVLPKYRTCIFVNGCFWHGHKGCSKFVIPKTRTEFWKNKITRNQERDLVNIQRLESIGWSAITVWECELGKSGIENTMEKIESMLAETGQNGKNIRHIAEKAANSPLSRPAGVARSMPSLKRSSTNGSAFPKG